MTIIALDTLDVRMAAVLVGEQIQHWEDLAHLSEARLLCWKGLGARVLQELKAEALVHGVTIGSDVKPTSMGTGTAQRLPPTCGVYFIQCEQFVKIGSTKDVRKRYRSLQLGLPWKLRLMKIIPTTDAKAARSLERHIQRRFIDARVSKNSEWFALEAIRGSDLFTS